MDLAENSVIRLACIKGRGADVFREFRPPNEEALGNFKDHSQDGGWATFLEILRASPFNKDLSNETTFRPIYLDGQYLQVSKLSSCNLCG
jgi:hypothetical protein